MDSKKLAKLQKNILKNLPTLKKGLKSGELGDLLIELYEMGQLPREGINKEIPTILCI